jgi:two-component system, NtrC family, response regulator HydG
MRSSHPAQPAGHHAAQGRILLVEDNPEAALFATLVLGKHGRFEVTHTTDPVGALALAATRHWDLVLTELNLPGMSGLDFLAALRMLAPRLPVAILAAYVPDACSTASRDSCCPDAVLRKPVPAARLLATVAALAISGRRAN